MKATDLLKMKKDLETILGIEVWNPTDNQLINIWNELSKLPNNTSEIKILEVVNSIYGRPLIVSCMEGLDTSVAMMALLKIKEMQSNIKAVEEKNANTEQNKPATGKG